MLRIDSISNINFFSQPTRNKDDAKSSLKTRLAAAAAAAGITTIALTRGRTKSFEKVMENQGIIIKDGLAVIKDSGEKFTGAIKRNVKPFGLKKETVQFEEGVMTERVYHDAFGREAAGEFYKDGILRIRVPGIQYIKNKVAYPFYIYDKNNKTAVAADNFGSKVDSVFEAMRNKIKKLD